MIGVLELLLGVDPAVDSDVGRLAAPRQLERLGDSDRRRCRQQATDPIAGPERAKRHRRRSEGDQARGDEDEGESPADHTGARDATSRLATPTAIVAVGEAGKAAGSTASERTSKVRERGAQRPTRPASSGATARQ